MIKVLFATVASLVAIAPASAVVVTYGAIPANVAGLAVETFDSHVAANATQSFTDTIGGVNFAYSGVNVGNYGYGNGTLYGGAYVGVGIASTGSYSLGLSQTKNYFGLLITAADPTNVLTFYNGASLVYTYAVGGNIPSQASSFVNFNFGGQSFDTVTFAAGQSTGFESDNHTIGTAVPEPATWALMLVGFGAVGIGMRRRARQSAIA